MREGRNYIALALAIVMACAPGLSFAGKSGGFGGGGGGGFGRSPSVSSFTASRPTAPAQSFGYTKPSAPAQTSYQKPGTAGSPTTASLPTAPASRSGIDQAVQRKQSVDSLAALKADRSKFQAPPAPSVSAANSPIASSYLNSSSPRPSTTVYYVNRDRYYSGIGWHPAPYVYYGSPYYGVWDTLFLYSMLDHSNAAFAYNHSNDADYRAWRAEADKQAQTNAELREKLAKLDESVKNMDGPKDPKYLPEGVTPEVALAANVVTGVSTPKLVFATGVEGSSYASLCEGNNALGIVGFKANAKEVMDVDCSRSNGSRDNVDKFLSGRVPMIIAQADALDLALKARHDAGLKTVSFGTKQLSAFDESMWLLVNKTSGITSVADLKPGTHRLYLGPVGSGSVVAYQNMARYASASSWVIFSKHEDQYEKLGVDIGTNYAEAIRIVSKNPTTALLVMMPGNSDFMRGVDREYGDNVKLVPINARGFTDARDRDGNVVYHECSIDPKGYPNLLGGRTDKTLCEQAVVVVSEDWVEKNPTGADALISAWEYTKADIVRYNTGVE